MGFANLGVAEVSKKDPFDSERRVIIVGGFEECVKAQNAVRSWGFVFETMLKWSVKLQSGTLIDRYKLEL